ncbi:hypothetical protein QZH41_009200 [Actinostola sp. cb2023]|nr:hypothetical protein QZH41_009200 [Actinostola sp. cb2023]
MFWLTRVQRLQAGLDKFEEDKLRLNLKPNKDGVLVCCGRIQGEYPVYVPDTTIYAEKRFYWPGMYTHVKEFCDTCQRCDLRKPRPERAPLQSILTTQPLELACMDFLSLEKSKGGIENILVVTDHSQSLHRHFLPGNKLLGNYVGAIELLERRYGKKTAIQQAHVNEILDALQVYNEKDTPRLRKLHDHVETHYRGLKAMGEDGVQEEFLDNITFNGTRYSVKLPWKIAHKTLPTNYANSIGRLKSTIRRLRREPDVLQEYEAVIKEQLKAGIIETVTELEERSKVHYLPHQAVVRRNAETTKVRVVYDASSKDGKRGVSLNDCLHVGPSNPLLFDILLRFRMYRVALIADIEKAFLNVEVDQEDRDCLRFLWPEDSLDDNSSVQVFRFCRVVFGLNASPFLLNGTLRHHLMKYKVCDDKFVETLVNGFYVDDLVSGANSTDEAYSLYCRANDRLAEGGFSLWKWKTNDKVLEGKLQSKELEVVDNLDDSYAKASLVVPAAHSTGSSKVLGILWDSSREVLEFDFKHVYEKADKLQASKRNVLSVIATLFDPLGLVSPITVSAKILFQGLM